ncbi:MAG: BACON domain-containing protein [Bacteroidales bacterium]|nr:BACON domain-containing protein [Bacteroidales bacterium]
MRYNRKHTGLVAFAIAMILPLSCNEEGTLSPKGDSFYIEGGTYTLEAPVSGISYNKDDKAKNRITIRSDADWEIVPEGEYDWVHPFPDRGTGSGYFYFIVSASTAPEERTAVFLFKVNGKTYSESFTVVQDGVGPSISVQSDKYKIKGDGADLKIPLVTNIDYHVEFQNDADWIKIRKTTRDSLCLSVLPSQIKEDRSATLNLRNDQYNVDTFITITQAGGAGRTATTLAHWSFPEPSSALNGVVYNTSEKWYKSDDGKALYQWYTEVSASGASSTYVFDKTNNYVRFLCQGMCKGDYAIMTIPVENIEEGTIEYTFHGSGSKSGPKFWLAEWSLDGNIWHEIDPKTTTEAFSDGSNSRDITWTYCYHYETIGSVANYLHDFALSFPFPGVNGSGTLYIRHTIADSMYIDRSKDSVPGYNGTTRVAIDIIVDHLSVE